MSDQTTPTAKGGYALRVRVDELEAPEIPLTDEQGRAFAQMLALAEHDPQVSALFEQILAQQWQANAEKMYAEGKLPIVPKLEDHKLDFELITPE